MKHNLLLLAGLGHFGILIASAMVPEVLDWKGQLALLHPFLRKLFWVYGAFIVLTIAALGTLTLVNLEALEIGDPVARSLAAFTAVFWGARLAVQFFVFDAEPFLTTRLMRFGYHTLTAAFLFFTVLYTWTAIA